MTATMKLYEITNARDVLDTWLAESEGEMTPELEAMLNELDGQADEKIERVALYVRERLANAEAVKVEQQRLLGIQKREEKAAESLKAYLKRQMEALGKTKVNGLLATIAIQKNSQPSMTHVLTGDALALHFAGLIENSKVEQFVREIPVSYTIDRDAVLTAWRAGDALPDEIIVEHGTHLRIR